MSGGEASTPPPTGQVTFLFTDVQGSSAAWEEHPESMAAAIAEHDRRIRDVVAQHQGYVFTTAGDSFAVAFRDASSGLAAAVAAQQRLAAPAPGPEIKVRMALHTGHAYERDGDFFGPVVNRCARLMSAGHGGQVLVSGTTRQLVSTHLGADVELIDLGEHQLKDLSRPERVFQVVHPSLEQSFPKLRTVDAALSNLPIQLTSFIGRDRELADVSDLINGSRLVTLAGPSGSGKTRLAIQLAAETIDEQPAGVALVELASIADPHLVADMVAATFRAQAAPGTPLVRSIASKIGEQRLLLLLDNCEHLIGPVGELVGQLLTLTPWLKVLATSQVPLGVPGEAVYRVPSLSVPEAGTGVADAGRFDAIALFAERAAVVKPSFELTPDNIGAVVEICRQLDGIPLALELAAARVAILAPEGIARRLGERFRLLAGGPRLADARHQTLHAAIDWSHDLLGDTEKALFRRCGIFSGSFDLEAVERICHGDPIDQYDVIDLVAALVDKSLVFVEDENDQVRYRLLESMRHYAQERLEESGETSAVGSIHASFYAGYAEELQRMYRSGRLAEALVGMRADRDNLRAALEFGLSSGQSDSAGRIIGGIGYLWYADGAFREGIEWCTRFFSTDPDMPPALMASVLHSYGTLLGSWAEPEAGAEILEREVALRRQLDDPVRLAAALNNLGTAYNDLGRREHGDAALREAVDLYRAAGESPAMSLVSLAWGSMNDGDHEEAMDYCEQSLAEARRADDRYDLALAAASTGACAVHLGRLTEARALLEDAGERYSDLGVRPGVHEVEFHLALVDRAEGRIADAARRLSAFLEEPDSHWFLAARYWALQVAASIIDDNVVAAELLGLVESFYEDAGDAASTLVRPAWVRSDLGLLSRQLGDRLGDEVDRSARAGTDKSAEDMIAEARRHLAAVAEMGPSSVGSMPPAGFPTNSRAGSGP